ncbi:coiled-coil domain-containing protein 175-like [Pseudophryne corroboree]|uniref:coiled-coil domain-containing protein 175-like n=1 Tax=Pseudophryne corroboree TaxID=495146 RepID=UPI003081BAEE
MTSAGLVPDCKAVSLVLDHVLEVEKQLREEEPAFDEETLQHLVTVADAVKELEDIRRNTRELLEVETIENSKLRYTMMHLPGIITKEIEAAITSAREAVASEMLQLQNELRDITLGLEKTQKKQTELEEMNLVLSHQERTLWDEHQVAVDLLNQQMAGKAQQSILVNQTHKSRKDAEDAVIEYQTRTEDLEEDMAVEKQQFNKEIEHLTAEIAETQRKTEDQEGRNLDKKARLSQRRSVLFDVEEKNNMISENISSEKDKILILQASHRRLTHKLDIQNKQLVDSSNKIDVLELSMANQKENFNKQSNSLKEKILMLDEEINAAEMLHGPLTKKHKDLKQEYQAASGEEDRQYAIKRDVATQLEKSRAILDEKQERLGKISMEVKEMKLEVGNLLESKRISTEQMSSHVEEYKGDLANESQKRMTIQIQKDEVTKEMELWKLAEEDFMKEQKKRIENGQKKKSSLSEKGRRLQRETEIWNKEICNINEEQRKANQEYSNQVQSLKEQIKLLEAKVSISTENLKIEQQKLSTNIPIMNEAEDANNKQHLKFEDLKEKAGELKRRQRSLELSISAITKEIEANSNMKETKKASLKALRQSAFEKLQNDLETIKLTDKDIYETNRKLELVIMENCRLKLQNAQYKEDITDSRSEAQQHLSATQRLEGNLASLIEHLREAWKEDNFVCSDFSDRDQEILDSIIELLKKINQREEKVGHLSNILQNKFIGLTSLLDSNIGVSQTV